MSKLLKSKFFLGMTLALVLVAGAVALVSKANAQQAIVTAADIQYAATVQLGSSGQAALIWQNFLNGYSTTANLVADGKFGPLSEVQAKAWQASRGLVADGVLGTMSRASAVAQINAGAPASAFLPGCTSTVGYSSVSGALCSGVTSYPAGCTSAVGYSSTTGVKCSTTVVVVALPAGCTTTSAFSSTTGASCTTGESSTSTGALTGGAGDATLTHYGTSEKSTIAEGQSDVKVLGFKVEATDSDIALNNVKVEVSNINWDVSTSDVDSVGDTDSSKKVSNYIDSVDIYMGSTKVGSADMADFTRTLGTGGNDSDVYSKTIAVSNAVVKEGNKDAFYVVFNAASSIDTENMDAVLYTEVTSFRFQDATGVVMTTSDFSEISNEVSLDTNSTEVKLKSSSSNPADVTVTVDDSNTTDDVLALAFKMEAADDSMDVKIDEIPLNIRIDGAGADVVSAESVIDSILVKIDGNDYTADFVSDDLAAGDGDALYTVDLNDEDVTLSAGDILEVKVYITFAEQKDNYDEATTVKASIINDSILMETSDDDSLNVSGAQTGAELTLSLSSATVTVSSKTATVSDDTKIGYIGFNFKVDATDNEVVLTIDDLANMTSAASDVKFTKVPAATTTKATLTLVSGDATWTDADGHTPQGGHAGTYTINEGDDATFALDITISGTAGTYRIRLDSVEGVNLDSLSSAVNIATTP